MHSERGLVPVERIEQAIVLLRGQKVIIDADLAVLYGVPTKALNQAVKRNEKRFPQDFMFRLTKEEKDKLVTNCDRFTPLRHSSALPKAFTEQGVAMLSSVLSSNIVVHSEQKRKIYPVKRKPHPSMSLESDKAEATLQQPHADYVI